MAENKDMQIKYNIFTDVWKLYKSFYDMLNDAEEWDKVITMARTIENKYNNQLCNDLLVAIIMDLERKHMSKNKL